VFRKLFAIFGVMLGSVCLVSGADAASTTAATNAEAIAQMHEQWLAGVTKAAQRFGCNPELIEQLPSENVAEAVKFFSQTAKPGSCLVLQPISQYVGPVRYSLASGGTVDGVQIRSISDVPQVRIHNGVATGN
jgi:hypothetical protein